MVRAAAGDNDATTWQVRLRLRRKTATSRGSRKQESSGGGRCASKDGRGGWACGWEAVATLRQRRQQRGSSDRWLCTAKGRPTTVTGRHGRKAAPWGAAEERTTVSDGR
ncbi:hypothetical protein BHM03_00000705 [Ensete ventricosum]|nr:hypothetical protein BHM03_00000705 [Ensete ventricosum]